MSYTTTWEDNGILWQLSGIVSSQEIFEFTNTFYADPRSDDIKYQIVDCSCIEKFDLGDETMREVASLDAAASLTIKNIKVALVGKAEHVKKINQEYSENFQSFSSNWIIKIFDDIDSARLWIAQ